jgi:soluble lytic murein transglycosylase
LYAYRGRGGRFEAEDVRRLYPRPWLAEVATASVSTGLGEYLLYALIRSESLFDASAASSAGAIGLTQLMPTTAADVAKKAGYESFDLGDPVTNLTLGSRYLAEMIRRLDGERLDAFFAYNAGITRVRQWKAAAASPAPLDADLFLETLPYAETREYGRKVLAAAVVYAGLYYEKNAAQIVRELF